VGVCQRGIDHFLALLSELLHGLSYFVSKSFQTLVRAGEASVVPLLIRLAVGCGHIVFPFLPLPGA
jgi:hypothetical protein